MKCLICGTQFDVGEYSGGVCLCGQKYEYDEAITIVLTEDQVEILQEHYIAKRSEQANVIGLQHKLGELQDRINRLEREIDRLDPVESVELLRPMPSRPLKGSVAERALRSRHDPQDQAGLPGEVRRGQEPLRSGPDEGGSGEAARAGGGLQASEEVGQLEEEVDPRT